jgi:CspA family cold shock protein
MTVAPVHRRGAGWQIHQANVLTIGPCRRHSLGELLMQGTIQSLRVERGFGFIRDMQGDEVVFHHTALPSPDHFTALTLGMVVEFEVEPNPKGPRASKVTRVPEPR